jgi:CRISPR-associated protein Cmr3
MVPAPMSLIQEQGAPTPMVDNDRPQGRKRPLSDQDPLPQRHCKRHLSWLKGEDGARPDGWLPADGKDLPRKRPDGGWIRLRDWPDAANPCQRPEGLPIYDHPWQAVPHLHPRLREDERVSAHGEDGGPAAAGALFLEYGIALLPGVSLAYLSSHAIAEGRYRFGGEGHLVELRCQPLPDTLVSLLSAPLDGPFALVTPGLWGGPRLSRRDPIITSKDGSPPQLPWHRNGAPVALLTERPRPWRHRLGQGIRQQQGDQHRLSRGRWAVPAGSCYRVAGDPLPPWSDWPEAWFPKEGFSFKQFGTALALPLT